MLTYTNPADGSLAVFEQCLVEPLRTMGVPLDENTEDIIGAATNYALTVWLPAQESNNEELLSIEESAAIASLGMSGSVIPPLNTYDGALLDGGSLMAITHRLAFWDKLRDSGKLILELIMFSGQRLRDDADSAWEAPEELAKSLYPRVRPWARDWIEGQLALPEQAANPWLRSFATEHEIALLALLHRYKDHVELKSIIPVLEYDTIDKSIPVVLYHALVCQLDDVPVRVMNAPAVRRVYRDNRLPLSASRPTARSCLYEYARHTEFPEGKLHHLISIARSPNIYRTWLDLTLGIQKMNADSILQLDAAGADARNPLTRQHARRALGLLLINLSNLKHGEDQDLVPPRVRTIQPQ